MSLKEIFKKLFTKEPSRDVALVLGGGGARGFAHIGAIEALEENGFHITSIAGTSMGALVGGMYAAGKLPELKERITSLTKKEMVSLLDFSIGLDHVATGKKLLDLLTDMNENKYIENLAIPFCCVSTDVVSGEEKVFREGSLTKAIRASISIPGFFKPVHEEGHIYVDGSVHNTLPLERVARKKGDILVAVNASATDEKPYKVDSKFSKNTMKLMLRITQISIQNNTQMAMRLNPPAICVDIPMDRYNLFAFNKGEEISKYGYQKMNEAIEKYYD